MIVFLLSRIALYKYVMLCYLENFIEIRPWIQKIQITPKIESFLPFTFSYISSKFHRNPSVGF